MKRSGQEAAIHRDCSGGTDCFGCHFVKEGGDSRKDLKTTLTQFPLFRKTKDLET